MPLDDNGFEMPEQSDVLANQKHLLKSLFGDDIDVSTGSVFGKLAMYETENILTGDEKDQQTYDGSNAETATGVQLDRQASNAGIQRKAAQNALVSLTITGQNGYVVPMGTEFETSEGDAFQTADDVELDYNGTIPIGTDPSTLTGTGTVNAISEVAASYENVGPHTVVIQTEPVDEIQSVDNPQAAEGGADLETDYSLRQRIEQSNLAREGDTAEGLKTALMNVDGVTAVHLQNNISDKTDGFGNPPHSVHAYVLGGQTDAIFAALFKNAAFGTTFVGQQEKDMQFGSSFEHIAFDRAMPLNIYIKVSINPAPGYDEAAVRQACDDYVDSFTMGSTLLWNKLFQFLYNLSGVDDVNDIQLSTDNETFSHNNIALKRYESAQINDDQKDIQITTTDNPDDTGSSTDENDEVNEQDD